MTELIYSNWIIIKKILINTFFVSFPEELFFLLFTLICSKTISPADIFSSRKSLIRSKYLIYKLIIPALLVSFASNILRYTKSPISDVSYMTLLLIYISILICSKIIKPESLKNSLIALTLFYLLCVIIVLITEISYVTFLLRALNLTTQKLNDTLWMNFALSIPARVMQYSVIYFIIAGSMKSTSLMNILKSFKNDIIIVWLVFISLIYNSFFIFIMLKKLVIDEYIPGDLSSEAPVFINIVLSPLLFVLLLCIIILYYQNKINKLSESKKNEEKYANAI